MARVIEDNFRSVTLQPGVGYTMTNSPGGVSMNVTGKNGKSSGFNPFQVILRITDGNLYAGVLSGKLFKGLDPSAEASIETFLTNGTTSAATDPGWIGPINLNDGNEHRIYLEIDVVGYTATIKHDTQINFDPFSAPWTGTSIVLYDPMTLQHDQTLARVTLADLVLVDSVPTVVQRVATNLQLTGHCIGGFEAEYPAPSVF